VSSQLFASSTSSANKGVPGVFGSSLRGTSGQTAVNAGSYAASEGSEVRTASIEGVNVTPAGGDENDQHSKAGELIVSCSYCCFLVISHPREEEKERYSITSCSMFLENVLLILFSETDFRRMEPPLSSPSID
jgi:hypothetical protein